MRIDEKTVDYNHVKTVDYNHVKTVDYNHVKKLNETTMSMLGL